MHIYMGYSTICKFSMRHPSVASGIACYSRTGTEAGCRGAEEAIYMLIDYAHSPDPNRDQ